MCRCLHLKLNNSKLELLMNKKNLRKIRSQMPNKEVSARG